MDNEWARSPLPGRDPSSVEFDSVIEVEGLRVSDAWASAGVGA
jgi:hypothetical protein